MELPLIILAIGFVFYLNNDDGISQRNINTMGKILDKEFTKRDKKIEELENKINFLTKELKEYENDL
tara:strand:+ start:332 stop:532 length:201 start_codon:yes stop_codon:yes gene_type:complete